MITVDAIEIEVLRNALTAAAADMDVTMWRTSRSTIVREMLDYSTAIFDADGDNVAQSARIPQHLNSMGYCLRSIIDRFMPLSQWDDGDVVITNDPYCGGQHLPDIVAFRPVFHNGSRVAIVDLSGSAPEVRGPINATLGSSSAVYFAIAAAADRPIAPNAGCYRPITIVAPEGLIISARHPAPVAHRIEPCHVLLNVLFAALSKAMPERMPAAYYACSYVCSFQTQAADGSRKVLVEIEVGGCGAHPLGGGANAQSFGMHNNTAIPMEMIESDVPVTFMGYGLVPGSGGRGQQRGGLGLTRSWRIDADSATFTGQMDRFRFRPFGLAGGEPGGAGRLSLVRDGVVTPLHSKVAIMRLRKGDIICLQTSGGGGFGPASARAVAAETEDRLRGYLS